MLWRSLPTGRRQKAEPIRPVTFGMSEFEEVCRGITDGRTPTAKPPASCRAHGNTRGTGRPFGSLAGKVGAMKGGAKWLAYFLQDHPQGRGALGLGARF